jgi:CheY-like chemotaxis protein
MVVGLPSRCLLAAKPARWTEVSGYLQCGRLRAAGTLMHMTVRALIVDDNARFLATACRLLEREGIAVVGVASTSAEALRASEEHHPDVILVDIDLGQESGFDLAERLHAISGRRQPVVLISAYSEQDLEELVRGSSAIGFVSKSKLSAQAVIEVLGRGDRTPSS